MPICRNISTRSRTRTSSNGPTHRRPARAVADQAMAESASRRAGWRREAAHERWQEQQAWHAAGRSCQPIALRRLHEPVPEALASQWTWRSASRTCRLLRRRLCHPQPRTRGRGADVDEGGDGETWADAQRDENLGEGRPAGKLRFPWLYARTTPLSQRWPLVSGRGPVQEKRTADQDESQRPVDTGQQERVAGGASTTQPPSGRLGCLLHPWLSRTGVSGC